MSAKDGSFSFDFAGTYNNVIQNELIEYVLDDGRKAAITFESVGDATNIQVAFEAESENPLDMQQAGWQAILDNFKNYVENN